MHNENSVAFPTLGFVSNERTAFRADIIMKCTYMVLLIDIITSKRKSDWIPVCLFTRPTHMISLNYPLRRMNLIYNLKRNCFSSTTPVTLDYKRNTTVFFIIDAKLSKSNVIKL